MALLCDKGKNSFFPDDGWYYIFYYLTKDKNPVKKTLSIVLKTKIWYKVFDGWRQFRLIEVVENFTWSRHMFGRYGRHKIGAVHFQGIFGQLVFHIN